MFRATIKIEKYWREGWDKGVDVVYETCEHRTFRGCEERALDRVKSVNNEEPSRGDVGIVLNKAKAFLVKIENVKLVKEYN